MPWPPPLTTSQQESLISNVKDYQLTHGSLLKLVGSEEEHTVLANPVGVTLFPTPFPKTLFSSALSLQSSFQRLYINVSNDTQWLYLTIKELIEQEPLAKALWSIHEAVERDGGYGQELELAIFRSDYMLHVDNGSRELLLKQVEFNTFSCAGGTHGNKVSDMHRFLQQTRAYDNFPSPSSPQEHQEKQQQQEEEYTPKITQDSLPENNTIKTIVNGLAKAHRAYGTPKTTSITTQRTCCILMIVQPNNFNIADERPLEYDLWSVQKEQPIPTYHLTLSEILTHTTLTPTTRELLYYPHPGRSRPYEVSVSYLRAGYDASEYAPGTPGQEARIRLERSRAIKCPSLLTHLATFKKVQQALTLPGVLERFLPNTEEDQARVRNTFVPLYPFDTTTTTTTTTPDGLRARAIVQTPSLVKKYILKPSLEGGGHNVYGGDIPGFLAGVAEREWERYVLMERICSPVVHGVLMGPRGFHDGGVVSELGVFGVGVWRRGGRGEGSGVGVGVEGGEGDGEGDVDVAWSFKTKDVEVDEMSVVKGYGCFDSPFLMSEEDFTTCCEGVEEEGS